MKKFTIRYGECVASDNWNGPEDIEAVDIEAATLICWGKACETYEELVDSNVIDSADDIAKQEDMDIDEAREIFNEEREVCLLVEVIEK